MHFNVTLMLHSILQLIRFIPLFINHNLAGMDLFFATIDQTR